MNHVIHNGIVNFIWGIAGKADLLLKGEGVEAENMKYGSTHFYKPAMRLRARKTKFNKERWLSIKSIN